MRDCEDVSIFCYHVPVFIFENAKALSSDRKSLCVLFSVG